MFAVNYSTLRDHMKTYFDKVSNDRDTMIVTRKNENVVVMSQGTYDSLMETLYLVGNKANYNHLVRSMNQYENGKITRHELIQESGDE